jgi:hypothetical protein
MLILKAAYGAGMGPAPLPSIYPVPDLNTE